MRSEFVKFCATLALLAGGAAATGEACASEAIYERIAAVERTPVEKRSVASMVQLGRDYRATGRPDDALVQAKRALSLAPDDGDALLLLGDVQFQRHEYRQALVTFDRLAQQRPGSSIVQLRRSQVLSAMGYGREAEAANALFLSRSGRVRAANPTP